MRTRIQSLLSRFRAKTANTVNYLDMKLDQKQPTASSSHHTQRAILHPNRAASPLLSSSDIEVRSNWMKATPDKLCNAITNFDELESAVRETDFYKMLD